MGRFKAVWHGTTWGWLGRSTIVSPSAHRKGVEELGLHNGKPSPACEGRIGRLARSRSVGAGPDLWHRAREEVTRVVARYILEACGWLCRWALHRLPNANVK